MTQLVSKAVGIDLGTTNSAVAVMNPTDSDIAIHKDPTTKAATTPSCVWHGRGVTEPVIGRKAFSRKGTRPEPISSIKRLMGTRQTVELGGEQVTPQHVSSLILGEMKRQIEADVAAFDGPLSRWIVDRAVVTVLAYFDQPQIDATREAAEAAGLEVLGLLHEPTAAASYHCWRTGTRDGTFLVYDLGGGTFDVSILRCTAGDFEVLGISGNNRLGGDDIDAEFARHLQTVLQADGWALDLDPEHDEEDRARFNRLKILAEASKKELSRTHDFMLRDSGLLIDKAGRPGPHRDDGGALRPRHGRPFAHRAHLPVLRRRDRPRPRARRDQPERRGRGDPRRRVHAHAAGARAGDAGAVRRAGRDSSRGERAKCAEPVYEEVDTVVALGAAVRAAAIGGMVSTTRTGPCGSGCAARGSPERPGTPWAARPSPWCPRWIWAAAGSC